MGRLFKGHPRVISLHPVFYLKGKNYLLEASFLAKTIENSKKNLSLF